MKKTMMAILLVACTINVMGQTSYARLVDSTIKYNAGRDVLFTADSIYTEFDRPSHIILTDSARLIYADSKGKKLLRVCELRTTPTDTTSIVYDFMDRKLIKIAANIHSRNRTVVQSFYFKDSKLVFPDNYFSEIFQVDDYIDQAKGYLKSKFKNLSFSTEHD